MLGLPDHVRACLFDLDGVLTDTAVVHAKAWKETFDDFLREWSPAHGEVFVPFDEDADYHRYVDGKLREDGARSFLASRGIGLPEGTADDPPGAATIRGLAGRKDELVSRFLTPEHLQAFDGSVRYVKAARAAGMKTAVVSSSAHAGDILQALGIADEFDGLVDGRVARRDHLPGKPHPDMFLRGADVLAVEPSNAAVFEDAPAGVEAGRAGGFGCVVGVDRGGQAAALRDHGASVVIRDLAELVERP